MENNELTTMVNLISKVNEKNVEITVKDEVYYYVPFNKNEVNLSDEKVRVKFIKSTEKLVRNSTHYKEYINYLKSDLKLDRCAVFGNIQSDKKKKTKIEMHHGPIFTLYDYVEIVLNKRLKTKDYDNLNTFNIAHEVLDLHRRKLVQTVMLSESVHQSMDNPKYAPFITFEQTFGDLVTFIQEYHEYFTMRNINSLRKYLTDYNKKLNEKDLINIFEHNIVKYNIKFKENNGG